MPKKPASEKQIESFVHDDASRRNIPPAEFQTMVRNQEKTPIQVAYERRNPDLDPQLIWRGKDLLDESPLVVNAPPLYIALDGVEQSHLLDEAGLTIASIFAAPLQIIDQHLRVDLLLDVERRCIHHQGRCGRGSEDRVLSARSELVESDDSWGFATSDGEPCGARGAAGHGAVHLL